jgi:hypothetical protein
MKSSFKKIDKNTVSQKCYFGHPDLGSSLCLIFCHTFFEIKDFTHFYANIIHKKYVYSH